MKLTIKSRYVNAPSDRLCTDYNCVDEEGNSHLVDLFVDGGIPNPETVTDEMLIGKTIEVDHLHPYLEIANGVKWPPVTPSP